MTRRALVLTAGLGTRLRPLTYLRAKAAVPVNGEPLARRTISWLVAQGITDLVLNLHYRPESITRCVGAGEDLGARVRYSWEDPVLGSAGGPRRALPLLLEGGRESFLLVNGDTLTDVDLADLQSAHDRSGAAVTMALIPNPRPDHYGGVRVSDEGFVTGFSRAGTPGDSYHFIGVQVVERHVFADLEDGVPAESVNVLYPRLIASNPRAIAAYRCASLFRDIGTPADCLDTSLALAANEGDRMQSPASQVAGSAQVERTALWDDVHVGAGAHLVECVVGDGARIPSGARYRRCAIVPADGRAPGKGERLDGELLIKDL